jgi:hypothetical protein
MASFLTKPKTKSETSSSTLQVQFKEIPNEDVGQDETLSEVIDFVQFHYMFFPSISLLVRMLLENKSDIRYIHYMYT